MHSISVKGAPVILLFLRKIEQNKAFITFLLTLELENKLLYVILNLSQALRFFVTDHKKATRLVKSIRDTFSDCEIIFIKPGPNEDDELMRTHSHDSFRQLSSTIINSGQTRGNSH